MFDKLIESDTAGAEFKNRSRYFTVSTIIVGMLFLTAVVYSLYAADIGLGSVNFDVSELVAPLETTEPQTPKPREIQPTDSSETPSNFNSDMARVDEPIVPTGFSTTKNSRPARSWEPFNPQLPESYGSGSSTGSRPSMEKGTGAQPGEDIGEVSPKTTEPPPPAVTKTVKPPAQSLGVINGKATYLPVPVYPQPARLVGASGEVKVQVAIDEEGRVTSAKAVSGHPLLRNPAETSARNAKFSPTYLSKVPVKVTGVIMYNFKKP